MRGELSQLVKDASSYTNSDRLTPWACVRHIEMISVLFGRKTSPGVLRDEVTKGRLLSLELSRLVLGINPVEDVLLLVFGLMHSQSC